jgi:hypothetical protein
MTSPDTDVKNAPDYINQFVSTPNPNGASELLIGGRWCGHGEELFRVYDIAENGNLIFHIQLPDTESEEVFPDAVMVTSTKSQKQFLIYDTRQHPASMYSSSDDLKFLDTYRCDKCNDVNFKISVGFEVPVDSSSFNDTTWFAMATECIHCGNKTIAFDNETA